MGEVFGKLILLQTGGPAQEFELGKATVSLGRALTNDVVLNDGRVSRSHARIACTPGGCTLTDLGSSNGTRVNGLRIESAKLNPGDMIGLGSAQLRFELSAPVGEDLGSTTINSEADLDQTINHEILPVAINETRIPRLVIMTPEKTWELPLDQVDRLMIGRTDENQVVLEHQKVSRRHAEVVRRGNVFVLRDLGSTNGTWYKDTHVDEMVLQNGDAFRIGHAQLVFKSGFEEESLTMADESLFRKSGERAGGRNPVVFVPGMFGSQLWIGNERVWPNIKLLFKNPELLAFPTTSNVPVEPRGILDEVVVIPNLIKMDAYNRMGDYLVEDLGYVRDVDFFEFAYDWRKDVRLASQQLSQLIDNLSTTRPVTVIAHSLGALVARYYIERLGGKRRVDRLVLLGGPHQGVVRAAHTLLTKADMLPFGIMGDKFREFSLSLPAMYEILPTYPVAVDQRGEQINFLEYENWLDEKNLPHLRSARQFRQELGRTSSIPTLSVFGYGIKTISHITVRRSEGGGLSNVTPVITPSGDSSILEKSAVLEGSEIHPVQQYHGSLFVDNDVKMRLKIELTKVFST